MEAERPHALVFPYPLQGHVTPFTHFSQRLVSLGITVTLVHTEANLHRILHAQNQPSFHENLHLVGISDGLPLDFDREANYVPFFHSIQNMGGALEQLVEKLHKSRPVTCIVYDPYFPWVQDVANKFNVPRFLFVTEAAAVFSICLRTPQLVAAGHLPSQGEVDQGSSKDPTDLITCIPGLPPLHPADLPFPKPEISFFFKLKTSMYERMHEVSGVLLNTFYELERHAIDGVRAELPIPILPVGPLLPRSILNGQCFHEDGVGSSLWKEEECLQWLDKQSASSVLYVSFGSLATLGSSLATLGSLASAQVQEIAMGLKATGQPFLWVFRPPSKISDVLTDDFLNQIKDQGLIIPWSPQLRVLSHPSVGAFITHCGWNSTIESISVGLPMLCWPQFLDQMTNCRFIVDVWKVGMEFKRGEGGMVDRGELQRMVRVIMLEEEGKEIRNRVVELRDAVKKACILEGGSSTKNFQVFAQHLISRSEEMSHDVA